MRWICFHRIHCSHRISKIHRNDRICCKNSLKNFDPGWVVMLKSELKNSCAEKWILQIQTSKISENSLIIVIYVRWAIWWWYHSLISSSMTSIWQNWLKPILPNLLYSSDFVRSFPDFCAFMLRFLCVFRCFQTMSFERMMSPSRVHLRSEHNWFRLGPQPGNNYRSFKTFNRINSLHAYEQEY